MIIYLITNTINGKQYVGQTVRTLHRRWIAHCSKNSRGCTALSRAIQKYGRESFTQTILSVCTFLDELNDAERYFIEYYQTLSPNGYNLTIGGDTSSALQGVKRNPIIGVKISATLTGRSLSDAHKAAVSRGHLGKTHSEAHKAAQSRSQLGRRHTAESRAKISASKRDGYHPRRGQPAWNRRPVINIDSGEIFPSLKLAAESLGFSSSQLHNRLTGKLPNDTRFKFKI